jgi:hypothetical protein
MQRNFEPMRKQVEVWQRSELTDVTAKVVIYEGFVEGKLEAPKHLSATKSRCNSLPVRRKVCPREASQRRSDRPSLEAKALRRNYSQDQPWLPAH